MLTQNSFLKILKQFRSTCGTLASRVRDIQYLNNQHPDRCQIKQPECILFGQPGSHLFTPFFDTDRMYDLNRIGADRVDLGLPKSTLSAPYLSSFYQ